MIQNMQDGGSVRLQSISENVIYTVEYNAAD